MHEYFLMNWIKLPMKEVEFLEHIIYAKIKI